MPRICTICSRSERPQIDSAITAGQVLRDIARRFATSSDTLIRHRDKCLSTAVKRAEAKRDRQALSLTDRLDWIWNQATEIIGEARAEKDRASIAPIMHQAHKNIEIRGLLSGELGNQQQPANQLNVVFALPRVSPVSVAQQPQVVDAEPVKQLPPVDVEPEE